MSEDTTQDRNQPATPKRRKEFADRGETPRSREVATVVLLLAGVGTVAILGPWTGERIGLIMREVFSSIDQPAPVSVFGRALASGMGILLPIFALFAVIALAAHVCQGSLAFSPKALMPKWERVNPLPRIKQQFFSRRTAIELMKSVGKAVILGGLTAWFVAREIPHAIAVARQDPASIGAALGSVTVRLGGMGALALGAIAVADLLFSRWDLEKRMMMTRQEVKQEMKEQDGDPFLRSRRRQRHRELSLNKVLTEVPKADVVVTNPTHVAVALRYDRDNWDAPRVTVKGAEHLALKIRTLARQHGVPVVENRPLARALHRGKIGQSVDPALYQAVAELYAFLYRQRDEVRS